MAIITSSMQTFTDLTDQRRLSCYLTANLPSIQIKDPNTGSLNPNWASTNLILTPVIFIENDRLEGTASGLTINWKRREGSGTPGALVTGEVVQSNKELKVSQNVLTDISSGLLTYICEINYYDTQTQRTISISSDLSFSLVQNATNAKLVNIDGEQLFKYDKNGSLTTPSLITLTAATQGVTILKWQYKNSSGSFVDYPTTSDNTNITGATLKVGASHNIFNGNTAIIKILTSDVNVYDTITITKLYDGATGQAGQGGIALSVGNESQQISCNNDGTVSGAQVINIPFSGFKGVDKVAVTVSATGLPTGITVASNTAATTSAEGLLKLNVANGSNLGGTNSGEVTLTFTFTSESNKTMTSKFTWSKTIKGDSGINSVILTLTTPSGNVISNGVGTLTINAVGYDGTNEITTGATYAWRKYVNGQWSVISGQTNKTLTVTADMIMNITSFECTMSYGSPTKTYKAITTLMDKTDPYVSEMIAIGGTVFKNGLGGTAVYIIVRRNGIEVDPLKGPIKNTAPLNPKAGDYWWEVDEVAKTCTLKKYSGSAWAAVTSSSEGQSFTYLWHKREGDGSEDTLFDKTGKVIYFTADDVNSIAPLQCDVDDGK